MHSHNEAEASELGLPPGSFPDTLGDGFWVKSGPRFHNGELAAMIYTHGPNTLEVFND